MFNNTTLVGRVKDNIAIKKTKNGNKRVEFKLVVTRNYLNHRGVREIDSFPCVAWNQAAENLARQAKRGSLVLVRGSLQNSSKQQAEILIEEYSILDTQSQIKGQKLRIKIPPRQVKK
ncbi:single-stranded DNA-binding protein [Bombilactobacillus bombi]|uniref:single-stranded DNA-binding protein n=1 Tax=Bombilactobacillus bombi TaxID=1303590 RepID=UPI0035EF7CEA